VYYRVYTAAGGIPSKSAWDATTPFLGRIAAKAIPPPHNVMSLKRCIVNTEQLRDPCGSRTLLFSSPASQDPMAPTTKLGIFPMQSEFGGCGVNTVSAFDPTAPYALVVPDCDADADIQAIKIPELYCPIAQFELITLLVHYQLFTQVGEDVSKTAFNLATQAIGRIEILRICPPPESVKRCIARVEGRAVYAYGDLFENIAVDLPLTDDRYGPLDEEGCLGSSAEWPLVLVMPPDVSHK
ncbi:hypothetical protein B0H14DRAFT_2382032, partial [Mycena olivaceomarginata]